MPSCGSRSTRWPTAASTTSSAAASTATPPTRCWLVPHFEQMLYDNAQLARVYLHAWASTGEARYRDVATGTLDYMIRELTTDDGAFAASQDADTEGVEGLTFVWSAAEIREVLGDDAEPFMAAYGVTDEGNWEGRTILSRVWPDDPHAAAVARGRAHSKPASPSRARGSWPAGRTRPQPARDDKALAAWNGLAIAAFADAARLLRRGRSRRRGPVPGGGGPGGRDDHRRPARDRRRARRARGRTAGRPARASSRTTRTSPTACSRCTRRPSTSAGSRSPAGLMDRVLARFADPAGGFFDTADDHERLVTRPKDLQDNAVPSGQRDRRAGAAAAGRVDRRGPLPRRRRAGAADGRRRSSAAIPTGFAQWLVGDGPGPRAGRRGGDRRRSGRRGDAGAARRSSRPGSARTRSWR